MNVYIANFGRQNYEWPVCKERSTIATMNEAVAFDHWRSRDKESYIRHLMQTKTWAGIHPTRSVASRWYNLMDIVRESANDYWIHRDGPYLWWTISTDGHATFEPKTEPVGERRKVVVCHKPCLASSNKDGKGRTLEWNALHVKAKDFLSTESTLQRLSPDYAEFARALIDGEDLAPWHNSASWKNRLESTSTKRAPAVSFTPLESAVWRMVDTAVNTTETSNGQQVLARRKNKDLGFSSDDEFRAYVKSLVDTQEGLCAITEIKLQYDGSHDDEELLCSLDRIDSNGHYAPGNLQVICRFVNRWKCAEQDATFRRLMKLVREH